MFAKNNVSIGISIGIFVPMIIFGLLFATGSMYKSIFKPDFVFNERTWTLVAVCVNMLIIQIPIFKYRSETKRGIALASMGLAVVWFLYHGINVFENF